MRYNHNRPFTYTYTVFSKLLTKWLIDYMACLNLLLVTRASCHYQLPCLYYRHHTGSPIPDELRTSVTSGPVLQDHLQVVVHSWLLRAASPLLSTCHTVCGLYEELSSTGHCFYKQMDLCYNYNEKLSTALTVKEKRRPT